MTTQFEEITIEQVRAGDCVSVNGPDERYVFEVKSIRDGMRKGVGLRTTEGEYGSYNWGTRFHRVVR